MALYRVRYNLIIYLLIIFALLLTGCKPKVKQPINNLPAQNKMESDKNKKPQTAVDANLQKADLIWVDEKGKPVWKAQFKEGHLSQVNNTADVVLVDVKAIMYKNGKAISSLVAPSVLANSKTRDITASGGVKVVSYAQNGSVYADKIVWKSSEDKVTGTGSVRMVRGNISATAHKFVADTGLNKVKLSNAEIRTN
ncbi:MAG: LPS export ABC transporter periplasmic protein LptC [Armatimonadota bacterium]